MGEDKKVKSASIEQPAEVVIEKTVKAAPAEPVQEITLGLGQVAVRAVGETNEDAFFITTKSDFDAKYSKGKNAGKFEIIAEKKS